MDNSRLKSTASLSYHNFFNFPVVHPCDQENKGGCEQLCTKKDDQAVCGCNEGYRVATDPKKCEKSKFQIEKC